MRSHRIALASVTGILALLAASPANADCDPANVSCSLGTAALRGQVTQKLGTPIDSGWLGKSPIQVRTTFTIDPVAGDPLVKVDLPSGAVVQATWKDKGFLDLAPITQAGQSGSLNVHYTLTPDLQAQLFGLPVVHYDATQIVNMSPGASFGYDAKAAAPLLPWGFDGAQVTPQPPALDQSTIFSLGFDKLGVGSDKITGALSVQAAANPVFQYRTTQVQLDSGSVTTSTGTTRVAVVDGDAIDVRAQIVGELGVAGTLAVKPRVQADTVYGIPTLGFVKYTFDAATVDISGSTTPVAFDAASIHIPLPNVKVPAPFGFGSVQGGSSSNETITITNTGEMAATATFASSDPQFVVSHDPVKIPAKGSYALPVTFKAISGSPASATITVTSNDPDSPEQTFKVGGNGADIGANDSKDDSSGGGCSTAPRSSSSSLFGSVGLGLALLGLLRRKR